MTATLLSRRALLAYGSSALLAGCVARMGPPTSSDIIMPVDPEASAMPDLVDLAQFDPRLRFDIRYATPDNFLHRTLYPVARALAQRPVAEALRRVQSAAEAEGLGLLIFDAYRPWRITKMMWDGTSGEARGYVANPATGSRHNRGCAIDLSLVRLSDGRVLAMPSAFDDLTFRARRENMDASTEAIANRATLERLMVAGGFIPLPSEWWHFDWHDWRLYPIMDQPLG
ncbi:MAG: M15 family metallopeptidase [Sphingopyxis sp.]